MDSYFCTGPYHIISAIEIKENLNKNVDGDCYIFNYFRNANKIYENLKKSGIFANVYFLDVDPGQYPFDKVRKFKISKKIFRAINLSRKKIEKYMYANASLLECDYQRMYVAGNMTYLYNFMAVGCKKGMDIFCFDDGLSNRFNASCYFRKSNFFHKIICEFNFGKHIKGLLYFNYEMTMKNYNIPLLELPNRILNKKELYYNIFDIDSKDLEKFSSADIIILSSGMEVYSEQIPKAVQLSEKEKEIYEKIINSCNKEVIIKIHPASKICYKNCNVVVASAPFEILSLGCDLGSKILISPFSAALFNPKFLFGSEPTIIMIYKLLGLDTMQWFGFEANKCDDIINSLLIKHYENKSKIIIPKEFIEVEKILSLV